MRDRSSGQRGPSNAGPQRTDTPCRARARRDCSSASCDRHQGCAPCCAGVGIGSCWSCRNEKSRRTERVGSESAPATSRKLGDAQAQRARIDRGGELVDVARMGTTCCDARVATIDGRARSTRLEAPSPEDRPSSEGTTMAPCYHGRRYEWPGQTLQGPGLPRLITIVAIGIGR